MKKFNLLLNGLDLDTGNYAYFPYTDKKICDFKNTFRTLTQIKTKKLSEDSEEANKYIYAKYSVGNENTNTLAIDYAYKAYQKFSDFSLSIRKKILLDMHKLLLEKKEDFIKLLIIEGHPRKLAEWEFEGMNIGTSPETINYYCKQIRKEIGRNKNDFLYTVRRADGVICMSPPANASASNSYNAIFAFLMGNALVLKPPLKCPLSTIFLYKEIVNLALLNNNAPNGTLNIILGNSKKIMEEWLESSKVSDVIFFGDSIKGFEMGKKIFQAEKKPILELSGNDFLLVWKDSDIEKASDSVIECFLGSTQICMVPKIALIHNRIYEKFVDKLKKKVTQIKAGLPTDNETMLSPVGRIQDFFDFLDDALSNGAKLIYGGERINHLNKIDNSGVYIKPTLISIDGALQAKKMRCINEEIFFPLLPLIKISGSDKKIFEDMTFLVKNHQYGLRTSLWINSPLYLRKFIKHLPNCGILRVNSRHVGFSNYISTHGGTRKSGGPFGEMNYFWQKTSHLQGISLTRNKL